VLSLGADKAPNLIALHTPDANLAHVLVMVFGTCLAQINEELGHRIYGDIR
jgi:hypothetical protein